MRTAIVSDLHLGTRTRIDLLRRERPREALAAALTGADQLILLGDAIELRDRPLADALTVARPFLEAVGAAMRGGRVVFVPGNHDHRLAWEAFQLRCPERRRALGLVQEVRPGRFGALAAIRDLLGTEMLVAYPGFWVADGVWATHGHYLDVHSAAPTLECVAAAVLNLSRGRGEAGGTPAEYEALLWPTYGLFYAIAQRRGLQGLAEAGKDVVRTVEGFLGTRGGEPVTRAPGGQTRWPRFGPGLGGQRLRLAPGEVRRPGVLPFGRVLDRLGVEAESVLFGHTHRTAPMGGDDLDLWRTRAGTALYNTGSWVYEPAYLMGRGSASPYWPGTLTIVDGGPPKFNRLLSAGC